MREKSQSCTLSLTLYRGRRSERAWGAKTYRLVLSHGSNDKRSDKGKLLCRLRQKSGVLNLHILFRGCRPTESEARFRASYSETQARISKSGAHASA